MNSINEQREIANDIAEAISNTGNVGIEIDDVSTDRRMFCLLVTYWMA
jgi:hypothetical protein